MYENPGEATTPLPPAADAHGVFMKMSRSWVILFKTGLIITETDRYHFLNRYRYFQFFTDI